MEKNSVSSYHYKDSNKLSLLRYNTRFNIIGHSVIEDRETKRSL